MQRTRPGKIKEGVQGTIQGRPHRSVLFYEASDSQTGQKWRATRVRRSMKGVGPKEYAPGQWSWSSEISSRKRWKNAFGCFCSRFSGWNWETGQISKPSEFTPGANYSSRVQGSRETRKFCRNFLHEVWQIGHDFKSGRQWSRRKKQHKARVKSLEW